MATTPTVLSPRPLRAGAAALAVTFAVDDPTVARPVTATDLLPTITVPIGAGVSATPTSVAAGGVAFDPLLPGNVTVTASAPGFQPHATATRTVTVNPAALNLTGGGTVGAGLVSGEQAAGSHEVRWDGTDDAGRQLAAGVYLVRFQAADGVRTGKMSLVK